MKLERIDEIIAKNINITDQNLYEGVFNAVLEAVNEENEACAKVCEKIFQTTTSYVETAQDCAAAIRARGEV